MKTAQTIGIAAVAVGAAALLYRPIRRMLRNYADSRAAGKDHGDELVGKFAGHYLGLNRHHSRKADKRKHIAAS